MKDLMTPWIYVFERMMTKSHYDHVIRQAVEYLPRSSNKLRRFVYKLISPYIEVKGFHSFHLTPPRFLETCLQIEAMERGKVATAVICLWAEKQTSLIQFVRTEFIAQGLNVSPWSWTDCRQGFPLLEQGNELMDLIIPSIMDKDSTLDDGDLSLAALMLFNNLVEIPSLSEMKRKVAEQKKSASPKEVTQQKEKKKTVQPIEEIIEPNIVWDGNLLTLQTLFQENFAKLNGLQQTAIGESQAITIALQKQNLTTALRQSEQVKASMDAWQKQINRLQHLAQQAHPILLEEFALRPDLRIDKAIKKWPADQVINQATVEKLAHLITEILAYDQRRQEQLDKFHQIEAQFLVFQDTFSVWEQINPPPPLEDSSFLTLKKISQLVEVGQKAIASLENKEKQLRKMTRNHIQRLLVQAKELDVPAETSVGTQHMLADLTPNQLAEASNALLVDIEWQLTEIVTRFVDLRSVEVATLTTQLSEQWHNETLLELLQALAKRERDTDAVLLHLAANAVHPRQQSLSLSDKVVYSLLHGVGHLSQKTNPFAFLNLITPSFLNGWQSTDSLATAELCLILTAVHYSGAYALPDGVLWQIATEWPLAHMPTWQKLWQALLLEEQPIIQSEPLAKDTLAQAKRQAQASFQKKEGRFVSVSNIQSHRHTELVSNTLLPALQTQLNCLIQYQDMMEQASVSEHPPLLAQFQNWLQQELLPHCEEARLIELYETGVKASDIMEDNPFLQRASLKVLTECAQSIIAYGQKLNTYWEQIAQGKIEVDYDALQAELAQHLSPQTPLGQLAMEYLGQNSNHTPQACDDPTVWGLTQQTITQELVTQPKYIVSYPRLIASLVQQRLNWTDGLPALLQDIGDPMEVKQIPTLLVEANAPQQALYLNQYSDVTLQKQTQQQQKQFKRELAALEIEWQSFGELPSDWQQYKAWGCYLLVIKELQAQLLVRKEEHAKQEAYIQEIAQKLRQTINTLDNEIFTLNTIPSNVKDSIDKGFARARRALKDSQSFPAIERYLEAITYRLTHHSWAYDKIHKATQQFIHQLEVGQTPTLPTLSAENALSLLEGGLQELGLEAEDISMSMLANRKQLLQAWLDMRTLPSSLSEKLTPRHRNRIHTFYRLFAHVIRMTQLKAVNDKPLIFETPIIHTHFELTYPQAEPLKRRCILLTLAGQPPHAEEVSLLETLIEDRQWLEMNADYAFVLLFIPHSTTGLKKRLQRNFMHRGLVIVDEAVLIHICLAMGKRGRAIEQLRPLMLRSLNAETISIFQVNQACHPRTSIFVGRTKQISRIVNSNHNHAIYGGRRIGKTSVLRSVQEELNKKGAQTILYSFEGVDCSDEGSVRNLARKLGLPASAKTVDAFRLAVQEKLDEHGELHIVLLLDEVDRYIVFNQERHLLMETLRALSDYNGGRFRVIIAGFMAFYDCLQGRGPYTPTSDPWQRMLEDNGPLGNLQPEYAEDIVTLGFQGILGWQFETPMIPQRIIEQTGGHPAFVQYFCNKLQALAGQRNEYLVRTSDIQAVFAHPDPEQSFIAHVRKTLGLNLEPLGEYLLLWLAEYHEGTQTFTLEQMKEIVDGIRTAQPIPQIDLERTLERLMVTSVIKHGLGFEVYEFTVPDYANILCQLGETKHLTRLEQKLAQQYG